MIKQGRQAKPFFEAYVPKKGKIPSGSCVWWVIVDGKAVQCGKPCKGQRCEEHRRA